MEVRALGTLLAVAVHVIPAEFADDVLELAEFAVEAKAHVEIGTTLVDVAVGAVLPFVASLLHKFRADLEIMAKVALVPVPTTPHRLVLVAGLYLALVVGIGAVVAESALPVDEFLAYSIRGQLVVVCRGRWHLLLGGRPQILRLIYVSRIVCQLVGVCVHFNFYQSTNTPLKRVKLIFYILPPFAHKKTPFLNHPLFRTS